MEIYFKYFHQEKSVGKNAPTDPGKQKKKIQQSKPRETRRNIIIKTLTAINK